MLQKIKNIINKKNKSKIICLTAYSKNVAEAIDPYTDIILIGDSLGSVLYNYTTTKNVTLHSMIEHSKSARQGIKNSLMVVDMPYRTYNNKSEALRNAKKIINQTKCDAVKLEGGSSISKIIEHLVKNKIPLIKAAGHGRSFNRIQTAKGRESIPFLFNTRILQSKVLSLTTFAS